MKSFVAVLALCFVLAASPARAQAPSQSYSGGVAPNPAAGASALAPGGNPAIRSGSIAPNLTPASELRPPGLDLPREPIEPYLLSKENGPFMVLARVFRGVDAERMARSLCERAPNHAPAFHLAGVLAHRLKRNDAAALLGRAVAIDPRIAEAHNDRGAILAANGSLEES